MSWFTFDALKKFFNKFWYQQDQLDEPVVTYYSIGSKRSNDENVDENTVIKRRKLSPTSDADVVHIDLTDSPSDINLPDIMPKRNKRAKSKRAGVKNKDNNETIEIIDDDDSGESTNTVQSTSNDVEIVEDVSIKKNLKKNSFSSFSDTAEMHNAANKHESARDVSKAKSYLTLSSIRPSSISRIQRNRVESRTLKELNNRATVSNGYPSEVFKKSVTATSPTATSRTVTRSFSDRLMLSSLKKLHNRSAFLDALKKHANSPLVKRSSASNKSLLSLKTSPSSSTFDSGSSDHIFGTFPSQRSVAPVDSKKSNKTLEFSFIPRYSTRSQNSLYNRSSLVPTPNSLSSVSSKHSDTSAINKTVIDLTSEEDDESQRQEIISNIVASDYLRNLKTSFVGKDKTIADPDYIYNLLKKYEAAFKANDLKAQKIRQQIQERSSDVSKTISEIFEKRLIIKEHEIEEEPKPAFELAPITKAMGEAINQIVATKKVPLVQIKDTSVKLQDIKTLENCAWLNDEVINAYMNLIKMRAEKKPDKYPKVHCFNTFLYEQLQKKGYNSVRRWTKKIDIFDFTMLIIPIHLGNHWCLIQIQIKEKCIKYFDSMGSPNNHCLKSMMQYLVDEYKDKKNGVLEAEKWKLVNMPSSEIPQQRNMHDCGVFACTFAEHLTRQAPLNFSQENMQYFRVKMMYEILTAELLL